jgi:hypothetical protein
MKTTHQIAAELLALPDIPLIIEGWCVMDNHEMVAKITDYCDNTAIIMQKPDPRLPPRTVKDFGTFKWINTPTQLPGETATAP